jgi:SAM-dependent methyltransferase
VSAQVKTACDTPAGTATPAALLSAGRAAAAYQRTRRAHWDALASTSDRRPTWNRGYHDRLAEIYRFLIPPGRRVLELGCGQGDLLAALQPARGVGVDFSGAMVQRAARRHPDLTFVEGDVHRLPLAGSRFEYVVASDLINDLWDVQAVLGELQGVTGPRTRLILNTYSRVWEWPLAAVQTAGLAQPVLDQNWLTPDDVAGLLYLGGWEVIRTWTEILWPVHTPIVAPILNKVVVKLWPFRAFALTNFVLARPLPTPRREHASVSIVIPARNEAGNIGEIFERAPEIGRSTELIFVEGHSTDDTYTTIERAMADHPQRRCQLHRQPGTGKADAVRLGFSRASGELLMILDADLTVPPEDLTRFYEAWRTGQAEFVNGVRLVYPIESEAMRFMNLVGNKFFSLAFSWLLGQPIKDSLCGTKVLSKTDYELIAANRSHFGDFDPFGDFDLLFGAAKLGLKIVDLPIRYRARQYGTTNISRWTHGLLLLRMTGVAARRIKFS